MGLVDRALHRTRPAQADRPVGSGAAATFSTRRNAHRTHTAPVLRIPIASAAPRLRSRLDAGNVGAAVIDDDGHGFSGPRVRYRQPGAERKGPVGGGHAAGIERLAAGG